MKKPNLKLASALILILFAGPLWLETAGISAQTVADTQGEGKTTQAGTGSGTRKAVFQSTPEGFVFLEGESAVSTNFAREATLNYDCSGSRALQLNKWQALAGGASYYAEYVFSVADAGSYQFWIAGTPPGPQDEMNPSYASPLVYTLDGGNPISLWREDVVVVESYSPAFYFSRTIKPIELKKGTHRIMLEVKEKRRYDSRYFFYIDSLFFMKPGTEKLAGAWKPRIFPKNTEISSVDMTFKSIQDCQYLISVSPQKIQGYVDLASIYTLVGDYFNALKILNKAALLEPENHALTLLQAKNRIWRGDVDEGLKLYRKLLESDPSNLGSWSEAGKVAAWVGRYGDSVEFYRDGLKSHPNDLSLLVNLGITNLWIPEPREAELAFLMAQKVAFEDHNLIHRLAEEYSVNGYPDRAAMIYEEAIRKFPERVDFSVSLSSLYREIGKKVEAEAVEGRIGREFLQTPELSAYLDAEAAKRNIRSEGISHLCAELEKNLDNLLLRERLAETYYWNGMRTEAIAEQLGILSNYQYQAVKAFDRDSSRIAEKMGIYTAASAYFELSLSLARGLDSELRKRKANLEGAEKKLGDQLNRKAEAERQGKPLPPDEEEKAKRAVEVAKSALSETAVASILLRENVEAASKSFETARSGYEKLVEDEKTAEAVFRKLSESTKWEWNPRTYFTELEDGIKRKDPLAPYNLFRAAAALDRQEEAEKAYQGISSEGLNSEKTAGRILFLLGQNKTAEARIQFAEAGASVYAYYPPFRPIKDFLDLGIGSLEMGTDPGRVALFDPGNSGQIDAAFQGLGEAAKTAQEIHTIVEASLPALKTAYEKSFVRRAYQLDMDTARIRAGLGDYALNQNEVERARLQFLRVLAVDPLNTQAIFSLARISEMQGNWSDAMNKYGEVYELDPSLGVAARAHNRLATENADSIVSETTFQADSSAAVSSAEVAYSRKIDSFFTISEKIRIDNLRSFDTSGYDDFQRISIRASMPLTLFGGLFRLSPMGGFSFGLPYGKTAAGIGFLDFFRHVTSGPEWGGELAFTLPPVSLTGSYESKRILETFAPAVSGVRTSTISVSALGYFTYSEFSFLKSFIPQLYGSFSNSDDGNFFGSARLSMPLALRFSRSPEFTILLRPEAAYEDSLSPKTRPYYAPDSVLTLRGGLSFFFDLGTGRKGNLKGELRFDAGGYASGFKRGGEPSLYLKAGMNAEYERNDGILSFDADITDVGFGEDTEYWTCRVGVKFSARLPSIILP